MSWDIIFQYALTQGAFALVAVCLGWYIVKLNKENREALEHQQQRHDEQMEKLIQLNEKNTTALIDLHSVISGLNLIVTNFLQEILLKKQNEKEN